MGTRILGYFKLKRLKEVLSVGEIDADKKELTFAELVQYLNERSLSRVIMIQRVRQGKF